jgi:hypothetical protein
LKRQYEGTTNIEVELTLPELTRQAAAQEAQYANFNEEEEEDEATRLEREYNQLRMQYESKFSLIRKLIPFSDVYKG